MRYNALHLQQTFIGKMIHVLAKANCAFGRLHNSPEKQTLKNHTMIHVYPTVLFATILYDSAT